MASKFTSTPMTTASNAPDASGQHSADGQDRKQAELLWIYFPKQTLFN